jgi:hypothetical protein
MDTVNKTRKPFRLLLLALLASFAGQAQTTNMPKNFAGLYGGFDISNSSAFTGATYEYLFRAGQRREFGLKGSYTFGYRYGNLLIFESGASDPVMSSFSLVGTGYLFTGRESKGTGFYLGGEAGVKNSGLGLAYFGGLGQMTRPTVGLGLGWKWPLRKGGAIRWQNMLHYTGGNMLFENNLSATTTLAIGF